ncbi:MAG: M20/M25/M40 family metallo-hydrolase [bacterium]|nr:M20/M25/M40 family metallo-hydrolase [bacterium]
MKKEVFNFFRKLISLKTVSAQGGQIIEAANFLKDAFGVIAKTKVLKLKNANPIVWAKVDKGYKRTILFYNHFDVQPPEPIDEWLTPPFKLVYKDGRFYGRGVSDNKGGITSRFEALINSIDKLKCNVVFYLDGEEEIGSPNIFEYLSRYGELFEHDLIIWEGYGNTFEGVPIIPFGCKGLLYFELRCKVAEKDIHSSRAPLLVNPALRVFEAVLSICGSDGRIKLKNFYNKVNNSKKDYNLVDRFLFDFDYLKREFGIKKFSNLDKKTLKRRLILEPWFNVCGFYCGYTGKGAKTILPKEAVCKIDIRTMLNQDNEEVLKNIKAYLIELGFDDIDVIPLETSMQPARYNYDSYIIKKLINMAKIVYGCNPFILPNMPATGPISAFKKFYNSDFFDIGCGYTGSAEHAPNENIRISDYIKVVKFLEKVLKEDIWNS